MTLTVAQALKKASESILAAGLVDDAQEARIEAEVLLGEAAGVNRTGLYSALDRTLRAREARLIERIVSRRLAGEPVAYITNRREFYGLEFLVDSRVLVPRPETELLVELALANMKRRIGVLVCDAGTGCGCVAAAIAANYGGCELFATDASADALDVAAVNMRRLLLAHRVNLLDGDLLAPLPLLVHMVVANLPYIPTGDLASLPRSVRDFEPREALDGGEDGLDLVRRLVGQLDGHMEPGGVAFLEVGYEQAGRVEELARLAIAGAKVRRHKDLAGVERVVEIRLPA